MSVVEILNPGESISWGSGVGIAVAVVVAVVVVLFCCAVTVLTELRPEMLAMIRTVSTSLAVRAELGRFSVTFERLSSSSPLFICALSKTQLR
ncbi:MAG: hypothetical protein J07HQW2_00218 [Haloquadratum walsbyi J07HQW2]|jgi:hypothetical protein|uniref:Uncharacterized protein n=1 Tax=Haloquadratum walsbyi J07HQW2 TaxID=1238425 RepID=U1MU07_9EURY|nr:MAG: hypothetical protein J07HQW2_00218 [Haloquadratum walsbyi J07HQW2]